MIFGIGTDIIETERVEQKISRTNGFREYVFNASEIDYCEKQANKYENYAVRFAAKEALLKALGTGLSGSLNLNEILVEHHQSGQPQFNFTGKSSEIMNEYGFARIHLSMSHLKNLANAMVIIEK